MATTIESLFGMTPESLEAQRNTALQAEALRFAQLTPGQQSQMGFYMAGNRLGAGIGGLLGAQDPELARVRSRQEMIRGVNLTDPNALREAASQALQTGDAAAANMLASRAMELEKAQAELAATNALTAQRSREKAAADPFEQLVRTGKYTPASLAKYKDSQNPADLEVIDKSTQVQWDIKEVGVATGTQEPVYTLREPGKAPTQIVYRKDAQGNQIAVPYTGGVDRTTAKVTATASSKGAEAGSEEAAKLDARTVSDARTAAGKALDQAGVLKELLRTPQPISGTGAGLRTEALRVFSTLGLASPSDTAAVSNADRFNALAGERVLSFIKSLGTNPTDTDREFARTIGPALEKGTKTNADLIQYLLRRAEDVTNLASAMEEHFYNNNYSLKGFKSPLLRNLRVPSATNMTPDELARAAGGRIVNGVFVKDTK